MACVDTLQNRLHERESLGNLRSLSVRDHLIDFASNDYLGLSRSQELKNAIFKEMEGIQKLGSTGSRLLTGNSSYAEALEQQIAHYHGYEAGLLFNCGYMANVGCLSSLANRSDIILYDTEVHASIHDGIRLSLAHGYTFRHNDPNHLEQRLRRLDTTGQRFVCVESIYSIDGSMAPLEDICSLCTQYGADLIVDEAHAVGALGPQGRGLIAEKKLNDLVFAQIVTFGKALGTFGAIVLGSRQLREYLINFSRSVIYTTALPMYGLAAIKCAYEMLPTLEQERIHLCTLTNCFEGHTPIQSIKIAGNASMQHLSYLLAQDGFDVRAIKSPTVKRGHECLRVCLHAFNTEAEVRSLIEAIAKNRSQEPGVRSQERFAS